LTFLNLGILAHVDAGKTTLTERLLFQAGVIRTIGRVDDGDTQTDAMELERRRGITITSAVVTFRLDDVTVNVIDTPGHSDFIAEVERALGVLDGAVLVVSAVEGVQAQTRVLMRTLKRLGVPTLIFVNKIDRAGAREAELVDEIRAALGVRVVALSRVDGIGARTATATARPWDTELLTEATEALADNNEAFMTAFVNGDLPDTDTCRGELTRQTHAGLLHPVLFGSAATATGITELTAAIHDHLPSTQASPDGAPDGLVFKVERGPASEKIAYVRMRAGTLRPRTRPAVRRGTSTLDAKITAVRVFDHGTTTIPEDATPGSIAKVWGMTDVRIGDVIVGATSPLVDASKESTPTLFARPSWETVVEAVDPLRRGAAHQALTQLAEQDPLINLRHDATSGQTMVSLYGEVQKEVIQATLASDFGVEVSFRESTTIHIERPAGTGEALEVIKVGDNPFLATVGLRVAPAVEGGGVNFRLGVELGSMPSAFFTAVEDAVHATLAEGLYGWRVTDIDVTMTHSGYWARQSHAHGTFDKSMSSTAGDFRDLTPLVLMDALRRAGCEVLEPWHRFDLEVPDASLTGVLLALTRMGAVPLSQIRRGSSYLVDGEIRAASVRELQQRLPGLTSGEGVVEHVFERHQPVRGPAPHRPRTDHNPLNRRQYLLHVVRRVLEPPVVAGGVDGLDAVAGARLADRRGQVVAHRAVRQVELGRDVGGGGAVAGGVEDVAFAFGERAVARADGAGGEVRVDDGLAAVDRADGAGQALDGPVLDDEAVGARLQRAAQVAGAAEGGHHDHLAGRQLAAQGAAGVDAADAGHLDVQQRHVGAREDRLGHHVGAGADLGDDGEVGFEFQQHRQGVAHHRLVFGEHHLDHLVLLSGVSALSVKPRREVVASTRPPSSAARSLSPTSPLPGSGDAAPPLPLSATVR
jgi:ribosomal protection tetracycline resistance protein